MPQLWTIYLLRDNEHPTIGYVGQTRRDPMVRLRQHMKHVEWTKGRLTSKAKGEWFASLRERGILPSLTILETCTSAAMASDIEKEWVRRASQEMGLQLVNSTNGGQGVYPFDFAARVSAAWKRPECKARKSAASSTEMRRRWADPAFKEAVRAKLRAAWQRPERIEKNKAAWRDPQKREARLAHQQATMRTPEYRASQRARSAAWASTPENREKVAAEARARWADPSFRAKMAAIYAERKRESCMRVSDA